MLVWLAVLLGIMGLAAFLPAPEVSRGLAGYVPLHTALEVFAIAVAAMIFGVSWATRKFHSNPRALIVGIFFLGVALLDTSHMLSYQGMPHFVTPADPEKAINFWLAARAMAVAGMLYAGWRFYGSDPPRLPRSGVPALLAVVLGVVLLHVAFLGFPQAVPRTFLPDAGLTPFKLVLEYLLIGAYLLAALGFLRQMHQAAGFSPAYLAASAATMAMGEFFFTLYANVTDVYNLLGHVYKIIAYAFLYRALFVETVQLPYQELQSSRARLAATIDALPDLLFEVDKNGHYVAVHSTDLGKLAAPPLDLIGKNIRAVLPAEAAELCFKAIDDAERNGASRGLRIKLQVPEGERYFELSVARKNDASEEGATTFLVLSRDVTEVVNQEQRVSREAELNLALLALQEDTAESDEPVFLQRSAHMVQMFSHSGCAALFLVNEEQTMVEAFAGSGHCDTACAAPDAPTHFRVAGSGFLEQTVRSQQPVVIEGPFSDDALKGLSGVCQPQHRLVSLPVLETGQGRLVLVVGDPPQPYDASDVERLRVLAVSVWALIKRRRQDATIHRLLKTLDQSPFPVIITDPQARIEYVNAAFTRVSGYDSHDVLGRNPRILQSGLTQPKTYQTLWTTLNRGEPWYGEITNRRKDGTIYSEHALIYPVLDGQGRVTNYVAHKEDITQRKEAEDRIRQLSHYDQLTGLLNKATFDQRVDNALERARAGHHIVALLWLDLDNFKAINDSLGHALGDELLVEVSNRLRAALGDAVSLSRQSGDAFVALVYNTDQGALALLAKKVLDRVQEPVALGDNILSVSASIGIALYPSDAASSMLLSKCAEVAMYRMKQEGRNGLRFYAPDMQENTERALALSSSLKQAILHDEFHLVYQPQLDLASGRIVGAEALLRWNSPQWGMVSPGEFIPLAEQNGFIVQLGAWVLHQACRQVRRWINQGLGESIVAVNVSALQFAQTNFVEQACLIVQNANVPPHCIEIELTEAVALKNPELAGEKIDQLSQAGFKISIDDFGTGYSSMSYLKRFAVDKLKIDQSFVRDLDNDVDDQAIVSAIVQMAHSLGLTTIAEGVETQQQLDFLRSKGCDEIQGYFFSRPLTIEAFDTFRAKHAQGNQVVPLA